MATMTSCPCRKAELLFPYFCEWRAANATTFTAFKSIRACNNLVSDFEAISSPFRWLSIQLPRWLAGNQSLQRTNCRFAALTCNNLQVWLQVPFDCGFSFSPQPFGLRHTDPLQRLNMSLRQYGPLLDDHDIATMLQYVQIEEEMEQAGSSQPNPYLSQTTVADSSSASHQQPSKECPICLTAVSLDQSFTPASCGHVFCRQCITTYLAKIAKETKKFPIPCPSCNVEIDTDRCLALISPSPQIYQALQTFILEKQHVSCLRYCANPLCSAPFDFVPSPSLKGNPLEFRVQCPLCRTAACVKCKVEWHQGKTCSQYTSDVSRSGISNLARENNWQQCPRCSTVIDRRKGDCYYVQCTCGCAFCHKCGVAYKDEVATPRNSHGTPACSCGLFETDNTRGAQAPPAGARMGAALPGQQNAQEKRGEDLCEGCCATQ